jgi:hypothetical protein
MNIAPTHYQTSEDSCTIQKAARIMDNTYLVHARCRESPKIEWTADKVFQIIGGELYIRDVVYKSKNQATNNLIASFYALDEACRSSKEPDPAIVKACEARDGIMKALKASNYCIGKSNQSDSEMEWHECTDEIYNYSCKVDGKTYPLRVDENENVLEWRGKRYSLTIVDPLECGRYGWRAEGNGTSFKFCTATQGYGAIEDKDGNDQVQCNLVRPRTH